jgi:hypothetical protein
MSHERKATRPQQHPPRLAYTVESALDTGAFSSRRKLYQAISSGTLRTFKDGKRRMISADALIEYIGQRERATAEGQAT